MVWQLKQRKARELISRAPDSAPPSGHNQQAVNWFNGLIKRYRTKTKFNPKITQLVFALEHHLMVRFCLKIRSVIV